MKWLQGSPAIAIYLRLMGARIGRDTLISDIEIGAPDLLTIGDGASLGGRLVIANAEIVGNEPCHRPGRDRRGWRWEPPASSATTR